MTANATPQTAPITIPAIAPGDSEGFPLGLPEEVGVDVGEEPLVCVAFAETALSTAQVVADGRAEESEE